MSRSASNKKYFTFIGGLNTEAGPLTYPANTWQEGVNMIPHIDGSLQKRLAVNFESGYVQSTETNTLSEEDTFAFVTEEWNVVAGVGSTNFLVIQRGPIVYFYDNVASSVSATQHAFTVNLATYKAAGNPNTIGTSPITCTSSMGRLIITSADTEPILVTYSTTTLTITVEVLTLRIRDLYGVNDGMATDERIVTLSNNHKYNLLNQGWDTAKIDAYFASTTYYPTNAQQWISAKDASDVFSPSLLDLQAFGSTPAPKGHYLIGLFNRDRSTVSTVPDIVAETEKYRPTTCAFYAGRAWYAGLRSTNLASWVLFSQVADDNTRFGNCYQDADPTSEFISDLVATDGGVIPIQDAGTILRIYPEANSLLVFADNGVWQIVGGSDFGFSATSYEVKRVSNVGCINPRSIVEADQTIFYWAADGIWALKKNNLGTYETKNVTNDTIQTAYQSIPINSKSYASGRYHLEAKRIYWLYSLAGSPDGINNRFAKDYMLCLDMRIGAFYQLSIASLATLSPYVVDLSVSKSKTASESTFGVVSSTDDVVITASSDTVVSTFTTELTTNTEIRFLTIVPTASNIKVTFSRLETGTNVTANFKDWYSSNSIGIGYPAYIITGDDLGEKQGGDKEIQGVYLVAFFNRSETGVDSSGNVINPTSCLFQSRWDWTDLASAGKWSTEREIYRHTRLWFPAVPSATFNDGHPIVVTKNKLRGRGKSVVFKFTANIDKDMQLVGWAVTFLGNQNV